MTKPTLKRDGSAKGFPYIGEDLDGDGVIDSVPNQLVDINGDPLGVDGNELKVTQIGSNVVIGDTTKTKSTTIDDGKEEIIEFFAPADYIAIPLSLSIEISYNGVGPVLCYAYSGGAVSKQGEIIAIDGSSIDLRPTGMKAGTLTRPSSFLTFAKLLGNSLFDENNSFIVRTHNVSGGSYSENRTYNLKYKLIGV